MKSLIKQFDAHYVPAEWDGVDRSGIRVTGKTVLVLMDMASGKSGGEHGGQIILDDGFIEKMTAQSISGVLVSAADGAFCVNEDGSAWTGTKPQSGDRVNVAKYAGTQLPGRDGRIYRLMDYGCIGGVYLPDKEYWRQVHAKEKELGLPLTPKPRASRKKTPATATLAMVTGNHVWDPEDMRCKHCRVRAEDVDNGKAKPECPGSSQASVSSADAARA